MNQRNADHRLSKLPAGTTGAAPLIAPLFAGAASGAGVRCGVGTAGQGDGDDCPDVAGCGLWASAVLTGAASAGFGRIAPLAAACAGLAAGLGFAASAAVGLASSLRRPTSRA